MACPRAPSGRLNHIWRHLQSTRAIWKPSGSTREASGGTQEPSGGTREVSGGILKPSGSTREVSGGTWEAWELPGRPPELRLHAQVRVKKLVPGRTYKLQQNQLAERFKDSNLQAVRFERIVGCQLRNRGYRLKDESFETNCSPACWPQGAGGFC